MTMSSAVFGMPSAPTPVMTCAKPCGVGNEIAVRIGAQQRHRADVLVGQEDAEHLGLLLDLAPGGHAARLRAAALDQLAGGMRNAVGVERILAQEHLVGGVRAYRSGSGRRTGSWC